MAGEILTGNWSLDLTPGVQQYFGLIRPEWESIYDKFFDVIKTTERFKRYVNSRGLGIAAATPEGEGVVFDSAGQTWNYTLEQVVYTLGFRITEETQEDTHTLDVLKDLTRSTRKGMDTAKEIVHTQILNNALSASYLKGDGKALLDTAHPTASGGTFNNTLVTPAALSEASVEQLLVSMRAFIDERNIPMVVRDKKLMIHPSNVFNYQRIFKNINRPGTADRDISALNALGVLQDDPIVNPYLSDTNAFFIKTDVPDGLVSLERRPIRIMNQNVQNTRVAEFVSDMRFTCDSIDSRGTLGAAL